MRRAYLAKDCDGCWMVDYLNDAFATAGGEPGGWRELQIDGLAFVEAELARFKVEQNTKRIHRHERLRDYFRSRGPN